MRNGIVSAVAVLCLSFPIFLTEMKADESSAEAKNQSRWAEIDLTQYCGKTTGELIDTLGHDYELISFIVDDTYLVGFDFEYDDFRLSVYPDGIKYCQKVFPNYREPVDRRNLCDYKDIERERIGRIVVNVFKERRKFRDQ